MTLLTVFTETLDRREIAAKTPDKARWSKYTTFADIEPRGWALNGTEAAKYWQSVLPGNIWLDVADVFNSGNINSETAERLRKYFLEHSEFFQRVKSRPSDAYIFNYLYQLRNVTNPIDKFFPKCQSAIAIYERLVALKKKLPELIMDERERLKLNPKEKYLIDNVGSGDAPESIGMLIKNPGLVPLVHIRCVDTDKACLDRARQRVEEAGITEAFEFINQDIQKVKPRGAHMLLVIGILCPIKSKTCVKILDGLRLYSQTNGIVVFSTVQRTMIQGDPLCDLVMRLAGWIMAFKSYNEPAQIAAVAGWEPKGFFDDSMGFNRMTVAHLNPNWGVFVKRILFKFKLAFSS